MFLVQQMIRRPLARLHQHAVIFKAVYIRPNISLLSPECLCNAKAGGSRFFIRLVWARPHCCASAPPGLRVWFPRCLAVLQAEFQSQPRLRAAEESVHEGHGRPAVAPEPAHQDTQEVRGGCQRGRLLPVSTFNAFKTSRKVVCVYRDINK